MRHWPGLPSFVGRDEMRALTVVSSTPLALDKPTPGDRNIQTATPATVEDASLIDRPSACLWLYREYRDRVFRYVRACGATDTEAADVTASAFERALLHLPIRRRRPGAMVAWLFRVARNQLVDTRRRHRPGQPIEDLTWSQHPQVEGPDRVLELRERDQELRRRLARLPAAQQTALALRYAAGLPAREIGPIIGKSEAATQKLISRAIQALRETYHVAT